MLYPKIIQFSRNMQISQNVSHGEIWQCSVLLTGHKHMTMFTILLDINCQNKYLYNIVNYWPMDLFRRILEVIDSDYTISINYSSIKIFF